MNFLIQAAHAQAEGAPPGQPPMLDFFFLILLFVVFYFLLLRPQMKKAKEHKKLVAALSKGDEVVTVGGVLGRVNEVHDDFVTLEVADGVQVKVQKQAVGQAMPKGTIKSL